MPLLQREEQTKAGSLIVGLISDSTHLAFPAPIKTFLIRGWNILSRIWPEGYIKGVGVVGNRNNHLPLKSLSSPINP